MAEHEFCNEARADPVECTDCDDDPCQDAYCLVDKDAQVQTANGNPGKRDGSHVQDLDSCLDLEKVYDGLWIRLCHNDSVIAAATDFLHYFNAPKGCILSVKGSSERHSSLYLAKEGAETDRSR